MTFKRGKGKGKAKPRKCDEFAKREGLNDVQKAFLNQYATRANVTQAAWMAGVSRNTVYQWQRNDPVFAEAMDEAWHWHLDECKAALTEFGQISPDYAERVLDRWGQDDRRRSPANLSIVIQQDDKILKIDTDKLDDATGTG